MTPSEIRDLLRERARMWLMNAEALLGKGLPGEARLPAEVALELLDVLEIVSKDAPPVAAPKSGTGTPPEPWEPHPFQSYPGREKECWICGHEEAWPKHINGRSKEASP